MSGPLDPFDDTRPQLPDDVGDLTGTIRAIKTVLKDYQDRIEELEAQVASSLGKATGTISPFGGNQANPPDGYLYCYGQAVSREQYAALFTVIGVSWGAGDGVNTFNVPDLRGRFYRGTPEGTGRDSQAGRGVGSVQDDAIQDFSGSVKNIDAPVGDASWIPTASGCFKTENVRTRGRSFDPDGYHNYYDQNFRASWDPQLRTASETRVKNVAGKWVIKI